MSDDIVDRLQSPEVFISTGGMYSPVAHEAAAEITRLRAELATARREGMERAAQIAERVGRLYGAGVAETVSDVIRAAAKEGKP